MNRPYTYSATLEASARVAWHLDDVLGPGDELDFSLPFLPDALAGTDDLQMLDADERRILNQLRGHSYLRLFGLVEEFILPFVLDHARSRIDAEDHEIRALLQFAGEEAKHIELFKRFARAFRSGFGGRSDVIGPSRDIADAVLEHSQLGVALLVLHIEWMTQKHYVESVKTAQTIDPLFKKLLHHHWLEESQHAKIDTLVADKIASELSAAEVQHGIVDYERLVEFLKDGLDQQAELDVEALERATGRELRARDRAELLDTQRRSYTATFVDSGRHHPNFRRTLAELALV